MPSSHVAFAGHWTAARASEISRRRARAFQAARRHSRLVRLMRVLLPVGGAVAVAAFLVATNLSLPGDVDLSMAKLSVTRNSIIMDNPRLTGFGSNQQEYAVEADRAVQAISSPDEVHLESIKAVVQAAGRGSATVTAETGDYDNSEGTLKLSGEIAVDSPDGYTLRLRDADIDLKSGTMSSGNPVTVTYQDSKTSGERLSISGNGKVIVLEDTVRTTLMPPKRAAAPAAAVPAEPEE